jgi:hypothetical protein
VPAPRTSGRWASATSSSAAMCPTRTTSSAWSRSPPRASAGATSSSTTPASRSRARPGSCRARTSTGSWRRTSAARSCAPARRSAIARMQNVGCVRSSGRHDPPAAPRAAFLRPAATWRALRATRPLVFATPLRSALSWRLSLGRRTAAARGRGRVGGSTRSLRGSGLTSRGRSPAVLARAPDVVHRMDAERWVRPVERAPRPAGPSSVRLFRARRPRGARFGRARRRRGRRSSRRRCVPLWPTRPVTRAAPAPRAATRTASRARPPSLRGRRRAPRRGRRCRR